MSRTTHDLVVIGAGPAGMAAAITAARYGLRTALLDEQAHPGGQIYRNITKVSRSVAKVLGPSYGHGTSLTDSLAKSGVDLYFDSSVWNVDRDLTVTANGQGRAFQVRAPQLIAATGAMERPSPLPGWTLPGVMNAGAAQIALKSAGMVPSGRVVLAGGGPLLLLVAKQLLAAGAQVVGVVETSPASNRWRALRHLPSALGAPDYLLKGAHMLWQLRRAGIPHYTGAYNLRVQGADRAQALSFTAQGHPQELAADLVLLHHGVVPNTQLSRLLRVEHDWDPAQLAWHPRVDTWGETSLPGFRVAGDSGGIEGALAAEHRGTRAALGAAQALGLGQAAARERQAQDTARALARHRRIRPFLDALYEPPPWLSAPEDETIVCRCEEVTARQIRDMAHLGCQGPNQTKFFSRCGMGPCQGRMCGWTVTQILAKELNQPPEAIGAYHIRAPLKPIPLASLAALSEIPVTQDLA